MKNEMQATFLLVAVVPFSVTTSLHAVIKYVTFSISSHICAGLKDRMNLCLFCLSLVDGMFVAFTFLGGSNCLVRFFRPDLQTWWKWSVRSKVLGLVRGSLLSSGCLTMIISVERCVCVFLPLRATSLIRTRTMAVIIFTTLATSQAICLVYPLKVPYFWQCLI